MKALFCAIALVCFSFCASAQYNNKKLTLTFFNGEKEVKKIEYADINCGRMSDKTHLCISSLGKEKEDPYLEITDKSISLIRKYVSKDGQGIDLNTPIQFDQTSLPIKQKLTLKYFVVSPIGNFDTIEIKIE